MWTVAVYQGHVANPATKFEDPTTIRSWVTSYNGSHWLPLKMRTRPLRVRRFSVRVQNFGDLATFSVDFCILFLYAECLPYFYFRFVWLTDLESIPHASTPTSIIPTKFEVDMTIHCRVITFLSADTSRDFVTLTFDLLTLNSCYTWRFTWTKFEDPTPIRSWVMSYNVLPLVTIENAYAATVHAPNHVIRK